MIDARVESLATHNAHTTNLYRFLSACWGHGRLDSHSPALFQLFFLTVVTTAWIAVPVPVAWNSKQREISTPIHPHAVTSQILSCPEVTLLRENSCSWLLFRSCPARRHQNHCLYPNKDALSFQSLAFFIGNLCSLIVCLTCIHCVLESILKYLARYSVGVDRRGESTLL